MFRVVRRFENLALLAVLISLSVCFTAKAAISNVSLTWGTSTTPGIVGYNVYYGGASGNYTNVVSVGNSTNAVISGLVDGGTYYFAATALDAYGNESAVSEEISYIVPGILEITSAASSGNSVQIQFPVVPGKDYELQVSEDLKSWVTILELSATSNTWIQIVDPETGLPQRFYRLMSN
jgi:hypothetical protein